MSAAICKPLTSYVASALQRMQLRRFPPQHLADHLLLNNSDTTQNLPWNSKDLK